MEGEVTDVELRLRNAHLLQSASIQNVDTATPIHQNIVQLGPTNKWIHSQSMPAQGWDYIWMIKLIKTNRHLRPVQIFRGSRLNSINLPTLELLNPTGLWPSKY